MKGVPHGVVDMSSEGPSTRTVELFLHEVKGITYYADAANNVYAAEDIVGNAPAPRVVAKLVVDPLTGELALE